MYRNVTGIGNCSSSNAANETAPRHLETVEAQYMEAKTSVWWDIENCQVPKWCDAHNIAQNISSALVKMKYRGPVSISAYGDTKRIPSSVQNALSSTGIALNHVPAGSEFKLFHFSRFGMIRIDTIKSQIINIS